MAGKLFPLAFGAKKALTFDSGKTYTDFAAEKITTLEAVEPLKVDGLRERGFAASLCPITIGDVTGIASSTTPIRFTDTGPDGFYIEIALTGEQTARVGKEKLSWGKRENIAFFTPEAKISARTGFRSHVVFRLDPRKIHDTAEVMARSAGKKIDIQETRRSRVIPGKAGETNFIQIYERIFQLIDDFEANPEALSALPLEDMIYRTFLLSLFPEIANIDRGETTRDPKIGVICDYIRGNPDKWVSTTCMEALSGISSRSIQIAFRRTYGMSPMQWQRTEKLHEARKVLLGNPGLRIEDLAMRLSFPSVTAFSFYYRQLFGETPSQARKRAKL